MLSSALLLAQLISFSYAVLTPSEIDDLRVDILNAIDTFSNAFSPAADKPLAAHIVRLVFHDCAGPENEGTTHDTANNAIRRCDGCIHTSLQDHRGINQMAIQPLEPIYAEYQSRISRADFWAAAGNIALEYTASLSPKSGRLPRLPYSFGRPDCPLSPNGVTRQGVFGATDFPMAHLGWDPAFDFFKEQLGLTLRETAAVFGAHTLGKMHAANSGFSGQWTTHPAHFDNEYFVQLFNLSNEWDQTWHGTTNGFPQWHNAGRTANHAKLVMLNADYSLLVQMEEPSPTGAPYLNVNTGEVSCRVRGFGLYSAPQCPLEISFNRVRDYAADNQLFYNDFARGWNKILTNNQVNLTEVIPNAFVDRRSISNASHPPTTRNPATLPPTPTTTTTFFTTQSPTVHHPTPELVRRTQPPTTTLLPSASVSTTSGRETPSSSFCCIADKIPNWNGRCWGHRNEAECNANTNCHWDANNCRAEQLCLVRNEPCASSTQCCSTRCRPEGICS